MAQRFTDIVFKGLSSVPVNNVFPGFENWGPI